jgi:hypothetical protein
MKMTKIEENIVMIMTTNIIGMLLKRTRMTRTNAESNNKVIFKGGLLNRKSFDT